LGGAALAPDAQDAALEPDLLEELESMVRATCARHGVPRNELGRSERRRIRRQLLEHAVSVLGLPVTRACSVLRVSRSCAHKTLGTLRA
jgi:hypothetical protein